jgi:hypothetical protein
MLYLTLQQQDDQGDKEDQVPDQIAHYCRQCDYVEKGTDSVEPIELVSYKSRPSPFQNVNEYTKHDPALGHRDDVLCTNARCTKSASAPNDIVLYRADHEAMQFVFICAHCDWKWIPSR